jgi:hypothetical protein
MNPPAPIDPRLLEALSAYLDGRLEGLEKTALEARLRQEADLRLQLEELRAVRDSLRSLPSMKPPRPLTLSRAQVRPHGSEAERGAGWISARSLALGSALFALAFILVTSANIFSSKSSASMSPRSADNFALQAAQPAAGEANPAPTAAQPTLAAAPKANEPDGKALGGGGLQATAVPTPTAQPQPPCGEDTGAINCRVATLAQQPESRSASLPDFNTMAPYLEGAFGLAAVALAVLAIRARRR